MCPTAFQQATDWHQRTAIEAEVKNMQWETVIGLEIHAQLATSSKIFSGALDRLRRRAQHPGLRGRSRPARRAAGAEPRSGQRMAIKFGLAIDAEIGHRSVFARKNYFYPDLPKGYQISQFELPIVGKGHVEISLEDGERKEVGITRAHLEEDAGKSMHDQFAEQSGIDLNRAGTPLLEIVSEPDMRSAKRGGGLCAQDPRAGALLSKSATATCRKVRFAATPMSRYGARVMKTGHPRRVEEHQLVSASEVERQINFEIERQIER